MRKSTALALSKIESLALKAQSTAGDICPECVLDLTNRVLEADTNAPTSEIPTRSLDALRERIDACEYGNDDDFGVIEFINEIDEWIGS